MVIILLDGTMKLRPDNIHAGKYNKAYAGARLTAELKYLSRCQILRTQQ